MMSDDADTPATEFDEEAIPEDAPVDADRLREAIEAADDRLGEEVATLVEYVGELRASLASANEDIDDLTSRLKRAHADFENYKKRHERRREERRREATRRVIERVVDLRDDLERAVRTEHQSAEDLLEGIKLSLNDLDRLLDAEEVEQIAPSPGDEVDPHHHEVMMRVSSDQPSGTIAEVFQPGYRHGDTVIQEAQVTVSTGSDETEE